MNALAPLPADFDVLDETAFEAGAGLAARATPIRAFAQIQECPERPELLRRTTRQEVLGAAPDRIELLGQQALPEQTLLECWIDFPDAGRKTLLAGRVDRCSRDEGGAWRLELVLVDLPGTDLHRWRETLD